MKLKRKYRVDNNRQIWRIIPTQEEKLIIEEREPDKKQAYFHCLELKSGKNLFNEFQFEDKFWVGIETVKDDIIFFHKFAKPDMPKHKGIFAFDFNTKKIIWENPNLIFQFILEGKLYAYLEKFEGRKFYSLNSLNGVIIEELDDNYQNINQLRDKSIEKENNNGYYFPEIYEPESVINAKAKEYLDLLRDNFVISGKIEYLALNELLLINFHEVNKKGSMNNLFKAVDLSNRKYILEEILNKETSLFFTDSFFVTDDLLFLLFEKTRLEVYNIIY